MKHVRTHFHRAALRGLGLVTAVSLVGVLVAPSLVSVSPAEAAPPDWLRALPSIEAMPAFRYREGAERPRRVRVAGQEMYFRVERVEGRPQEVIAFYRSKFPGSTAWLRRLLDRAQNAPVAAVTAQLDALDRANVYADDERGMYAVLEPSAPDATPEESLARIETFTRTGSVSALWVARMVFAYADGEGTTVVSMWTSESFNVFGLEDATRRAEPPRGVPEPRHAQPLISAAFPDEAAPSSLAVYDVDRPLTHAWDDYVGELARASWTLDPTSAATGDSLQRVATFRHHDRELQVTFSPEDEGRRTIVALFMAPASRG